MSIQARSTIARTGVISLIAAGLMASQACSGGGGGSNDSLKFSGSLATPAGQNTLTGVADVSVCALGSCAKTDDAGQWGFSVEGNSFNGGDVLFTFQGSGVAAQTVVTGIAAGSTDVVIDFVQSTGTEVKPESVEQSIDDDSPSDSSSDDSPSSSSGDDSSDDSSDDGSSSGDDDGASSSGDDDGSSSSSDDNNSSSDDDSDSSSSDDHNGGDDDSSSDD